MDVYQQLKQRRKALGLQQAALQQRVGINQQQYQRIEAGGNPRLDTLHLLAQGLEAELLLVPKEKLAAVQAVLADESAALPAAPRPSNAVAPLALADDPWAGLLGQHAR